MTPQERSDYIKNIVSSAPPLSAAQRDQLSLIFQGGAR